MKIRITDPAQLPDLVEFLEQQGALVAALAPDEIEAGLIGSYSADAMSMELELRVRAWEVARQAQGDTVRAEVGGAPDTATIYRLHTH